MQAATVNKECDTIQPVGLRERRVRALGGDPTIILDDVGLSEDELCTVTFNSISPFICKTCGKVKYAPSALLDLVPATECQRCYNDRKRSERVVEPTSWLHMCPSCERKFKTHKAMMGHYIHCDRSGHEVAAPHCRYCNRRFISTRKAQSHMRKCPRKAD